MRTVAPILACLAAATAFAATGSVVAQTMAPPSSSSSGALGMSGSSSGGAEPGCGAEVEGQRENTACAGQQTGPATGPMPRPPSVAPTNIPRSPSVTPTPLPNQPGATR